MSNQFLDLLQSQLNDDSFIDQLSQKIGGADKKQTRVAAEGAVSALMGAMARNAQKPEQAQNLANALERDHDGSILEDAMGFLSGQRQPDNQKMVNGSGILNHLLGNKQGNVINMVSQMAGLDNNKTGNLMTMLAPLVMGALGKTKKQNGLGVGDLMSLLNGSAQEQKQRGGMAGNLIASFIDQDGDGDITDDVTRIGSSLLGRLFRRKK
jgi:hypothetical protein